MHLSMNLLTLSLSFGLCPTASLAQSLPSTQDLAGVPFSGQAFRANPLTPKTRYPPYASTLHLDSGNTRSADTAGPLGANLAPSSQPVPKSPFFWDDDDDDDDDDDAAAAAGKQRLTSIALCADANASTVCLAALDPRTLAPLATWHPPANQTLQITYLQAAGDRVVAPTAQGRLYEVRRVDHAANGTATFTTARAVDLAAVLPPAQKPLGAAWDAAGNVWFSTGGIVGVDDAGPAAGGATVGFVAPDGRVFAVALEGQVVENNMAVAGEVVYVSTGPVGGEGAAEGRLFGFVAGGEGVVAVFNETYDAGSGLKPGAFARGSGSSPGLVGDAYIAITDNADGRVALNVWRQVGAGYDALGDDNLVCSLPLFGVDASANDNALVTHWDAQTGQAGVVVTNSFNQPPMLDLAQGSPTADAINAASWNNLTGMPGEFLKVDIADGRCSVAWHVRGFHQTAIPLLSTGTGLLYTYAQDSALARDEGKWVWYWVAFDYRTGEEVWRVRAGAGGSYNNNGMLPYLGPDGALWIATVAGTVKLSEAV